MINSDFRNLVKWQRGRGRSASSNWGRNTNTGREFVLIKLVQLKDGIYLLFILFSTCSLLVCRKVIDFYFFKKYVFRDRGRER